MEWFIKEYAGSLTVLLLIIIVMIGDMVNDYLYERRILKAISKIRNTGDVNCSDCGGYGGIMTNKGWKACTCENRTDFIIKEYIPFIVKRISEEQPIPKDEKELIMFSQHVAEYSINRYKSGFDFLE